jgi:hypothetical protein
MRARALYSRMSCVVGLAKSRGAIFWRIAVACGATHEMIGPLPLSGRARSFAALRERALRASKTRGCANSGTVTILTPNLSASTRKEMAHSESSHHAGSLGLVPAGKVQSCSEAVLTVDTTPCGAEAPRARMKRRPWRTGFECRMLQS